MADHCDVGASGYRLRFGESLTHHRTDAEHVEQSRRHARAGDSFHIRAACGRHRVRREPEGGHGLELLGLALDVGEKAARERQVEGSAFGVRVRNPDHRDA
jgi:hypothetical protein